MTLWYSHQLKWLSLQVSADAQDDINNLTMAARTVFNKNKMQPPLCLDPTFQSASSLWNNDLIGREEEYHNASQVLLLLPSSLSAALCCFCWRLMDCSGDCFHCLMLI